MEDTGSYHSNMIHDQPHQNITANNFLYGSAYSFHRVRRYTSIDFGMINLTTNSYRSNTTNLLCKQLQDNGHQMCQRSLCVEFTHTLGWSTEFCCLKQENNLNGKKWAWKVEKRQLNTCEIEEINNMGVLYSLPERFYTNKTIWQTVLCVVLNQQNCCSSVESVTVYD